MICREKNYFVDLLMDESVFTTLALFSNILYKIATSIMKTTLQLSKFHLITIPFQNLAMISKRKKNKKFMKMCGM